MPLDRIDRGDEDEEMDDDVVLVFCFRIAYIFYVG
jgi:hypothetical protein